MSRFLLLSMALTVVLAQAAAAATIPITVANSGFEDVVISEMAVSDPWGSNNERPLPTNGLGWTFKASSGDSYAGLLRDGFWGQHDFDHQVAFLEGTGSISQVLSGFSTGTATVSFWAEARNNPYGPNGIKVTIGGTELTFGTSTTVTPPEVLTYGAGFMTKYISKEFDVTANNNYTLAITGTVPFSTSDLTTYIDNVSVSNTVVPEPSAFILAVMGVVGLLGYVRRKRK